MQFMTQTMENTINIDLKDFLNPTGKGNKSDLVVQMCKYLS